MSGFVENAKGIVGIIRDGLITLILILLFAMPATINARLVSAGFVEGDFGGLKWKAAVEDNNKQLSEATQTIGALQQQLDTTQAALKTSEQARAELAHQVTTTLPNSPIADAAAAPPPVQTNQIVQQNSQVVQNSRFRADVLRQRIELNDKLLATVPGAKQ
jgi:hypothetical protein